MLQNLRCGFGRYTFAFFFTGILLTGLGGVCLGEEPVFSGPNALRILENERFLLGTVVAIRAQEVQVNTGDLMPRFLSLRQAGDKHRTTPRVGDTLLLVVNDQNNVIQYHLYGQEEWHLIVNGKLLKPLSREQYWVLIQFQSGQVKTTPIDPDIWNKVAVLPVGTTATFLLDNTHTVIDVMR